MAEAVPGTTLRNHHTEFLRRYHAISCQFPSVQRYRLDKLAEHFHDAIGCDLGSRLRVPLCPFMVAKEHYERIEADVQLFLNALWKIPTKVFRGDLRAYADYLALKPEERMLGLECGKIDEAVLDVARPDGFINDTSATFIEANVGSGVGFLPQASTMASFYSADNIALRWAHDGSSISIADPLVQLGKILSQSATPLWFPRSLPLFANYELLQFTNSLYGFVESHAGCYVANPDEIAIVNGRLLLHGERIKSIFLGISTYQLLERWEEFRRLMPHIHQYADMTTSPFSLFLENKANLCILTDPKMHVFLTTEEVSMISRCIPRTRKVDANVAASVSSDRSNYVLKRSADKGGVAICIGSQATQAQFDSVLDEALASQDWIAQEAVMPSPWMNLYLTDTGLELLPCHFVARFFVFHRCLTSVFCSLSAPGPTSDPTGLHANGLGIVGVARGQV